MASDTLSAEARRAAYDELRRRSLGHFHADAFKILHRGTSIVPGPHLEAMVHVLERLAKGTIRRLIITAPPRHGKSELASGSLPAWILGNDPAAQVIVASYGLHLSVPLAGKARKIMKDPEYLRLFPGTRIERGSDTAELFATTKGGSVRAVSRDGAVTGLGTHFLVVDDFHKAEDSNSPAELERGVEAFKSSFVNRFDNMSDSRIVIVQQRLHESDLVGWALRTGQWHHLLLPAYAEQNEEIALPRGQVWHRTKGDVLAPKLMSASALEEMREDTGSRYFNAQFQGNPVSAEGSTIDLNWFGQYDEEHPRKFFHKMVQSWDPAISERLTADYSVGQAWGYRDGKWYLLDVIRIQVAFNKLCDQIDAWHKRWRADVLIIEGGSYGDAIYDEFRTKRRPPGKILAPTPRGSKEDRVAAQSVRLETGDYLLPASAPWLPAFRHELLAFPRGSNDDQVDAMVQFLQFVSSNTRWVQTRYDERGRAIRPPRPAPRGSRYYDGDAPSSDSWRGDDEEEE